MIVAGIGCRKGARATDIETAIATAFARAGVAISKLSVIATSAAKSDEPGIEGTASAIGVPLVLIPQGDLAAAGGRAMTRSERVHALVGVPSVAEAAALAAGGPDARLMAVRIVVGPVTCALAESGAIGAQAAIPSPSSGRVGVGFSSPSTAPVEAGPHPTLPEDGEGRGAEDCGSKAPNSSIPNPDVCPQRGAGKNGRYTSSDISAEIGKIP